MMKCKGTVWIVAGLLLIAMALFISAHNLWESAKAGASAEKILKSMDLEQTVPAKATENPVEESPNADEMKVRCSDEIEIPDYILNPNMEMPTEEVDGNKYIGILEIPALDLRLPVMNEWSYSGLKIAPCRYTGSVYLNNMVIAAHNYYSNFGHLKNLSQGDKVVFTDIDGNVFQYEVLMVETLSPVAVKEMISGNWDLTLFTCTVGGQSRVAVRCALVN